MYMERLTPAQREELLVFCRHMALVDLEFAPEEKGFLAALEEEAGIHIPPSRTVAEADLSVFDTKASRTLAAMIFVLVALVDCHLHENESKFMGQLAGRMGFEQDELDRIVKWAHDYDGAFRAGDEAACTWLRAQGETLIETAA